MWWASVGAGIIANFATVALTIGAGALFLVGRRRALLRFWGIADIRKIRIYISHLRIITGGALDAHGTQRSYQGSVVTQLESEMGAVLRGLFFASLPGGVVQPGWVKVLLFINADVIVQPAPGTAAAIDPEGTVVSLGSPGYNTVSAAIEQNCQSPVRFAPGNTAMQLPGNLTSNNPRQCFVVRLRAGSRLWFYAAGLSEAGTAAAANYLASAWRRLDRRYRKSPSFFVVLEISGDDFRNSRIIAEGALDDPGAA
jgi:hypothetical protein